MGYDIKLFCNNDEVSASSLLNFKVALDSVQANCIPTFSNILEALRDDQVGRNSKIHGLAGILVDREMKSPDWRSAVWIKANSSTESIKAFLNSI
jgi:hypothetical protein